MREVQRVKRLVIPLIKGMPIIIVSLLISLFIAKKAIQYSVPKYQSMAKIKLDDHKYGMSSNNLYDDLDVFTSENKIETEAEILKSPLLIGKAIDGMDLNVLVTRIGRIKETTIYKNNPFYFEYDPSSTELQDKIFLFTVKGNKFTIRNEEQQQLVSSTFGTTFLLENEPLTIHKNTEIIKQKKLDTNGEYTFNIKSKNKWISLISKQLDVKAIDKEIPVLRVVVKSEDPQFSADFANKLCETYVEDYIYTKTVAATKTLSFIDERMTDLQSTLTTSENSLEGYKIQHKVVNTLQETETGLREMSKLKLQLINLEMEEESIIELDAYISDGDYYEETAINFGFGDLVLTELVKKLKLYTDQKRDLELKYTANDDHIINVQLKIDEIEEYIKEAIAQNKKNIQTKRKEIEKSLLEMSTQFEDIPTREKEMRILERDFQINESVYTFLAQKKLEAQIASSALMSFHRIIQPAIPPTEPISPNKVLITFVCGFLGLIAGVIFVFGGKIVRGKIFNKSDVEKLTSTPVVGVLTKTKRDTRQNHEFATLATSLRIHNNQENQTIVITSSTKEEGKTYITKNLAETYSKMGYSVALLDINFFNPSQNGNYHFTLQDLVTNDSSIENFNTKESTICHIGLNNTLLDPTLTLAHKNMPTVIEKIQEKFDYVIIDTPGSVISIDALCMLQYADLCLYIIRAKTSKAEYVSNVDTIQEEFGFNKMKIVLNGAHSSTNYSGNYNGSQLHYNEVPKGLIKKIKYYFSTYSK